MNRISAAIDDVHGLDNLARMDSPIHRLDARAKVAVTAAFIITVVSFSKYEIAELMPLCLYPVALLMVGEVPMRVLFRYLLVAAPFVIMVGIFNPLLDREVAVRCGSLAISGGWISFLSIMIKFVLTVSASLILVACTGYISVCVALGRMGAPTLLVVQFLLLYRFIFILADEAGRMARAHSLRSQNSRRPTLRVWSSLAGHLLLRAYDRGLRLHNAMLNRGFDGTMRPMRLFRWTWNDSFFVVGFIGYFVLVRFGHVTEWLGRWAMEALK